MEKVWAKFSMCDNYNNFGKYVLFDHILAKK